MSTNYHISDFESKLLEFLKEETILYDFNHQHYKNNSVKKIVWEQIANKMQPFFVGTTSKDCQAKWRNLKLRLKSALFQLQSSNGTSSRHLTKKNRLLVDKMKYFKHFVIDKGKIDSLEPETINGHSDNGPSPEPCDKPVQVVEHNFELFGNKSDDSVAVSSRPASTSTPSTQVRFPRNSKTPKPVMVPVINDLVEIMKTHQQQMINNQKCKCQNMDPFYLYVAKESRNLTEDNQMELRISILNLIKDLKNKEISEYTV